MRMKWIKPLASEGPVAAVVVVDEDARGVVVVAVVHRVMGPRSRENVRLTNEVPVPTMAAWRATTAAEKGRDDGDGD